MTKTLNQWKIFFDSMNSKKMNLLNLGIFMLNVLLYLGLAGMYMSSGKVPYQCFYSCIWLTGAFMFFLRLFYNQVSLRFSKTLPCTKKLYTRYIWISFEVINFLPVLVWLILWPILAATGRDVSLFGFTFLLICVVHLIMSVALPFSAIVLMQEQEIKCFSLRFQKMGTMSKLLLYFFVLCSAFYGLYCILRGIIKNEIEIATGNWILLGGVLILIISCVLNRIIFNKMYEKIR